MIGHDVRTGMESRACVVIDRRPNTQPDAHKSSLAAGNFYGKGHVRRDELVAAAELLGIGEDRVHVLDHPDLQVRASCR